MDQGSTKVCKSASAKIFRRLTSVIVYDIMGLLTGCGCDASPDRSGHGSWWCCVECVKTKKTQLWSTQAQWWAAGVSINGPQFTPPSQEGPERSGALLMGRGGFPEIHETVSNTESRDDLVMMFSTDAHVPQCTCEWCARSAQILL